MKIVIMRNGRPEVAIALQPDVRHGWIGTAADGSMARADTKEELADLLSSRRS